MLDLIRKSGQPNLASVEQITGENNLNTAKKILDLLRGYVDYIALGGDEMLFRADTELAEDRDECDPVKPAKPSPSAPTKKATHETASGQPVHSFGSLLAPQATRVRNTHQVVADPSRAMF